MIINASGNIGIGTNTPGVRLDVAGGQARVNSNATTSTALTTTGRVGVNQAAPTVPLDVTGAARITGNLDMNGTGQIINLVNPVNAQDAVTKSYVDTGISNATASGVSNPAFQQGTATVSAQYLWPNSGQPAGIYTNNTSRLYVQPTGNIGIGTTSPTVAFDVAGAARVNNGATTSTALTTTGRVGINQPSPEVPLDVTGEARITGNLSMSSSGKIINLVNPNADQDAATKSYVDTKTTDMATSSTVSTVITTALGSSGTQENRPTVARGDTTNAANYLTFIDGNDIANDGSSKRALMRCDANLYYNPNTNTLNAGAARITGELDMNNTAKIINLLNPTNAQDAATKSYVDSGVATATAVGNAAQSTANTAKSTADGLVTATTARSATAAAYWLYPPDGANAGIVTNTVWRLQCNSSGKTGIGEINGTGTDIIFPLHVFGSVSGSLASGVSPTVMTINGTNLQGGGTSRYISICAQNGDVAALNFAGYSDKRIKKNIHPLNPDKSIEIIRDLNPVSYNYIDSINNSTCSMYGFIAQEVKNHIPDAISYKTDYIPNLYSKVELSKYPDNSSNSLWKVTLITSYTETNKFTFYPNKDNSWNDYVNTDGGPLSDSLGNQKFKIKFIMFDLSGCKTEIICYTHKLINDKEFIIDASSVDSEYNPDLIRKYVFEKKEYLLYGQEVIDFHNLTYDYLWCVYASSLKEVDRQQQVDKARIAELENQVSNLESTVAAQQSLINDILERLKNNGM
jgi:hypothetical protein